MTIFDRLWILWIIAFAVIEAWAIYYDRNNPEGPSTLSDHIRRWFRVKTFWGRTVWLYVVTPIFVGWFFLTHIPFG